MTSASVATWQPPSGGPTSGIGFYAELTSDQTLASGAIDVIIFDSDNGEDGYSNDPADAYNNSTGVWICPLAGYWNIQTQLGFEDSSGGARQIRLAVAGGDDIGRSRVPGRSGATTSVVLSVAHVQLNLADAVTVEGSQTSGGIVDVIIIYSWFSASWAGPLV